MLPTAAEDVIVVHTRWFDTLSDEDADLLDTLLADDLTFHSPSGRSLTKSRFLEGLRSGRVLYDSVMAEVPLTRIHGQTAIVTGKVDIELRSGGRAILERLYYTAVYGWSSPHWQMLAWQSTHRSDDP